METSIYKVTTSKDVTIFKAINNCIALATLYYLGPTWPISAVVNKSTNDVLIQGWVHPNQTLKEIREQFQQRTKNSFLAEIDIRIFLHQNKHIVNQTLESFETGRLSPNPSLLNLKAKDRIQNNKRLTQELKSKIEEVNKSLWGLSKTVQQTPKAMTEFNEAIRKLKDKSPMISIHEMKEYLDQLNKKPKTITFKKFTEQQKKK